MLTDPANSFPASEFDDWAGHYDRDVHDEGFPFSGYERVLDEVIRQAEVRSGMTVLDVGLGTGNLAEKFLPLGCDVWGSDFSAEMLALAQAKLPGVHLFLHDLRQPFPPELARRFDRIVSAYVFHHFDLPEKVAIASALVHNALAMDGRLIIADISFPHLQAKDIVRREAGDEWDEEPYWVAAAAIPALEAKGITVAYQQVSNCAGVYRLST